MKIEDPAITAFLAELDALEQRWNREANQAVDGEPDEDDPKARCAAELWQARAGFLEKKFRE